MARGELDTAGAAWRVERRMIDELLALDATPHTWRRTRAIGLYHLALLQQAHGDPAARDTVLAATEVLEDLATARPTDRRVHRWLSRSYLLLGTLEGSLDAAAIAFARAAETIEPFIHGGRDGRVLAPWADALRCLGRLEEARPVAETLRDLGYAEPGLGVTCTHSSSSVSSLSGLLRSPQLYSLHERRLHA